MIKLILILFHNTTIGKLATKEQCGRVSDAAISYPKDLD